MSEMCKYQDFQPKLRKRALKYIGLKSEEYLCETCGCVEVYRIT